MWTKKVLKGVLHHQILIETTNKNIALEIQLSLVYQGWFPRRPDK